MKNNSMKTTKAMAGKKGKRYGMLDQFVPYNTGYNYFECKDCGKDFGEVLAFDFPNEEINSRGHKNCPKGSIFYKN